jgi:uncharacterized protein (TIGR03437 family)
MTTNGGAVILYDGNPTITLQAVVTTPPPPVGQFVMPTITLVANAASLLNEAVSPGEIVSIFGAGMGPVSALTLQLDSTGNVSTSLGGVQVLFNGTPAPLAYVSATQINCVVPYEIVGLLTPSVQVKYLKQTSNLLYLSSAATSPGIFATNGTRQGAILNQNGTVNGPNNPELPGNIITVYATGEGQTSPSGVTGSVTCANVCATVQQIPVPLLPVVALVGNEPATITFYGEAPGLVSGVLQVDVMIPPNTPAGTTPLIISIGGNSSQGGVTFSVR